MCNYFIFKLLSTTVLTSLGHCDDLNYRRISEQKFSSKLLSARFLVEERANLPARWSVPLHDVHRSSEIIMAGERARKLRLSARLVFCSCLISCLISCLALSSPKTLFHSDEFNPAPLYSTSPQSHSVSLSSVIIIVARGLCTALVTTILAAQSENSRHNVLPRHCLGRPFGYSSGWYHHELQLC
jgi:hypothetical protein